MQYEIRSHSAKLFVHTRIIHISLRLFCAVLLSLFPMRYWNKEEKKMIIAIGFHYHTIDCGNNSLQWKKKCMIAQKRSAQDNIITYLMFAKKRMKNQIWIWKTGWRWRYLRPKWCFFGWCKKSTKTCIIVKSEKVVNKKSVIISHNQLSWEIWYNFFLISLCVMWIKCALRDSFKIV